MAARDGNHGCLSNAGAAVVSLAAIPPSCVPSHEGTDLEHHADDRGDADEEQDRRGDQRE